MFVFFRGIYDFFSLVGLNQLKNPQIINVLSSIFILNMLIFNGSIILFTYLICPLFDYLKLSTIYSTIFYYIFWILPMYLITLFLNTFWYQDISKIIEPKCRSNNFSTLIQISNFAAEEIYRIFVIPFFYIQIYLIVLIFPEPLDWILEIVFLSWIYSMSIFEYTWAYRNKSLIERISIFHKYCLYMLGFGLPITLMTYFFQTFISIGIFSCLYPILMIKSKYLIPRSHSNRSLPIFTTSYFLASLTLRYLLGPIYRMFSRIFKLLHKL